MAMALPLRMMPPTRNRDIRATQIRESKEQLAEFLIEKYHISDDDLSDEDKIKSILREIQIDDICQ